MAWCPWNHKGDHHEGDAGQALAAAVVPNMRGKGQASQHVRPAKQDRPRGQGTVWLLSPPCDCYLSQLLTRGLHPRQAHPSSLAWAAGWSHLQRASCRASRPCPPASWAAVLRTRGAALIRHPSLPPATAPARPTTGWPYQLGYLHWPGSGEMPQTAWVEVSPSPLSRGMIDLALSLSANADP